MEHKKIIGAGLFLLMLFATACTGNSANGLTAKKVNGLPSNAPAHIAEKLSGHVRLNADVIIPTGIKKVPVLKADIYNFDPQIMKTELIGNLRIKRKKNPNGSIQEFANNKLYDKNGKPILICDYVVSNGEAYERNNDRLLVYGAGQTIFMTTEYNYTFYTFQRDTISGSYSVDLYTKKSLPFMKPDSAFANVEKKLKAMGMNVGGNHDTFCLDNETSEGIMGFDPTLRYADYVTNDYATLDGKGDWGEFDDYYYFILYPKYHGIPIAEGDGSSVEGGTLDVAYCERGIEYLMANSLYKETGVLQPDVKIYGLDGALQMLKYKYDNTILTEPVTVSSIRFCYVPQPLSKNSKDYELTPAWQFTIRKAVMNVNGDTIASNFGGSSTQTETINIYFDATTGKEIIGSTPRL